jgi:hypothetical protein
MARDAPVSTMIGELVYRSSVGLPGGYVLCPPTYREMTMEKTVHPLRSSPPGRYLTKSRQI